MSESSQTLDNHTVKATTIPGGKAAQSHSLQIQHIPTMREFAFTPLIRIFHWTRFLSILILIATGFYIAWPFLMSPKSTDILVQGWLRFGHLICGFLFSGITIVRCYLFLFSKDNSERRSLKDALRKDRWIAQIKAYIFLGKPDEKAGLYGPMQLVTYAVFYTCSLVMVFTGLALYAHVYHQGLGGLIYEPSTWLVKAVGGLANLRNLHHYFTWVFIVFLFLHVYLAIWTGLRFKKAAVDAIISGYDYHTEEHLSVAAALSEQLSKEQEQTDSQNANTPKTKTPKIDTSNTDTPK